MDIKLSPRIVLKICAFLIIFQNMVAHSREELQDSDSSRWEIMSQEPNKCVYLPWNVHINEPTLRGESIVFVAPNIEPLRIYKKGERIDIFSITYNFSICADLAKNHVIELEMGHSTLVKLRFSDSTHLLPKGGCGNKTTLCNDETMSLFYFFGQWWKDKEYGKWIDGQWYRGEGTTEVNWYNGYKEKLKMTHAGDVHIKFFHLIPNYYNVQEFEISPPLPSIQKMHKKGSMQKTKDKLFHRK